MTIEIRLIGSPDEVRGLTEWFEAVGLPMMVAADKPAYREEGSVRRYITAESPTTFPQNLLGDTTKLTLTSHPGDGNGHPPAI